MTRQAAPAACPLHQQRRRQAPPPPRCRAGRGAAPAHPPGTLVPQAVANQKQSPGSRNHVRPGAHRASRNVLRASNSSSCARQGSKQEPMSTRRGLRPSPTAARTASCAAAAAAATASGGMVAPCAAKCDARAALAAVRPAPIEKKSRAVSRHHRCEARAHDRRPVSAAAPAYASRAGSSARAAAHATRRAASAASCSSDDATCAATSAACATPARSRRWCVVMTLRAASAASRRTAAAASAASRDASPRTKYASASDQSPYSAPAKLRPDSRKRPARALASEARPEAAGCAASPASAASSTRAGSSRSTWSSSADVVSAADGPRNGGAAAPVSLTCRSCACEATQPPSQLRSRARIARCTRLFARALKLRRQPGLQRGRDGVSCLVIARRHARALRVAPAARILAHVPGAPRGVLERHNVAKKRSIASVSRRRGRLKASAPPGRVPPPYCGAPW